MTAKPRVLVLTDVSTWCWQRKAEALARWLGGADGPYEVVVWPLVEQGPPPKGFDLYHTFDFPNVEHVHSVDGAKARHVTGITAHVWRTWGESAVRSWASQAAAIHANSILLADEMEALFADGDPPVFYTPNGVDPGFFRRTRPRNPSKANGVLVVGHVGKPNPRKGAHLLREACARADEIVRSRRGAVGGGGADGVEFHAIQRRHNTALTAGEILDYYQDLHLLAVASDMDGTPNPALEAAACEVAVLSNWIGNMPEFVVSGVNGWLVDREVAAYVERLVEAASDLGRVEAMGHAARASVLAGWTWEAQVGAYDLLWRAALGSKAVGR